MSEIIPSAVRSPRHRRGGPRRWSAAQKAAYLAAFATSRLSGVAFCRAQGVPRATFTLWQREARELREAREAREARAARAMPGPRPRHDGPAFAAVELLPAPGMPRVSGGISMVVRGTRGLETELAGLDRATAVLLVRLVVRTVRTRAR